MNFGGKPLIHYCLAAWDDLMDEAFIAAIHEAPNDGVPLLVYTDWLEERGDARAEYLRVLSMLDLAPAQTPQSAELLTRLHQIQLRRRIDRRWIVLICRNRILRALQAFQTAAPRQEWPKADWLRKLAQRFNALPVWADLGGVVLLQTDGELLVTEMDDDETPSVLQHRGWRLIAWASAAEFFPELRPLLPARPLSAESCPACHGQGIERWWVEGTKGITPCGACWGLGWRPERPLRAVACKKCSETGRQAHRHCNRTYESSCDQCCGWGWVTDDPIERAAADEAGSAKSHISEVQVHAPNLRRQPTVAE